MGAAAVLLPDGRVLMAGGHSGDSISEVEAVEVYDPVEDRWTATASMIQGRRLPTLTVLESGRVIAWGGVEGLSTAEMFDLDSGSWTFDGRLPFATYWHTATLLADGTILVVGSNPDDANRGAFRYIPLEER